MRSLKLPVVVSVLALVVSGLVLPEEALAQRRHRGRVVVGVGYPYYSPFYWSSFYGPWGPWGPYGYWPPPYQYYGGYGYASELRIMATPREAEVYVDGYLVGTVDDFDGWSQRLRLQPGEHDIELYLEGHRSVKQRMLLRPGETYKIRAALERLADGEEAAVRPTPAPAPAPATAEREPYGPRRMPRAGTRRMPDSAFGTLAIRVQPADAEVRIDGEAWDRPPDSARLTVELAAGSHRVEVRRDGHTPYESTVEVRRGEITTLNVSLPEQ